MVKISHDHDPYAHAFFLFWSFVKATLLAILMAGTALVLTLMAFAYVYLHKVSSHAGISTSQLIGTARQGWQTQVPQSNGRLNILLLGVDTLGNRDSSTVNTDTIMVASLALSGSKITTFSIPRDLFLPEGTKVNGIYDQAKRAGDLQPELK